MPTCPSRSTAAACTSATSRSARQQRRPLPQTLSNSASSSASNTRLDQPVRQSEPVEQLAARGLRRFGTGAGPRPRTLHRPDGHSTRTRIRTASTRTCRSRSRGGTCGRRQQLRLARRWTTRHSSSASNTADTTQSASQSQSSSSSCAVGLRRLGQAQALDQSSSTTRTPHRPTPIRTASTPTCRSRSPWGCRRWGTSSATQTRPTRPTRRRRTTRTTDQTADQSQSSSRTAGGCGGSGQAQDLSQDASTDQTAHSYARRGSERVNAKSRSRSPVGRRRRRNQFRRPVAGQLGIVRGVQRRGHQPGRLAEPGQQQQLLGRLWRLWAGAGPLAVLRHQPGCPSPAYADQNASTRTRPFRRRQASWVAGRLRVAGRGQLGHVECLQRGISPTRGRTRASRAATAARPVVAALVRRRSSTRTPPPIRAPTRPRMRTGGTEQWVARQPAPGQLGFVRGVQRGDTKQYADQTRTAATAASPVVAARARPRSSTRNASTDQWAGSKAKADLQAGNAAGLQSADNSADSSASNDAYTKQGADQSQSSSDSCSFGCGGSGQVQAADQRLDRSEVRRSQGRSGPVAARRHRQSLDNSASSDASNEAAHQAVRRPEPGQQRQLLAGCGGSGQAQELDQDASTDQ